MSKHAFKAFEGNRDALDELSPPDGVPQTAEHWLGRQGIDQQCGYRAYGPERASAITPQGIGVKQDAGKVTKHGTDVKQDAEDRDTEQFFRSVDEAVLGLGSDHAGQRLILAALPRQHHLFRSISRNPHLMRDALEVCPDALPLDEPREPAWQLVQSYHLERLAGLVGAFRAAHSHGRGAEEPASVAKAATAGRVEALSIEADRLVPGRVDAATGALTQEVLSDPAIDDVLDDLGEQVLGNGGEAVIVPTKRMPTRTGVAAIHRL